MRKLFLIVLLFTCRIVTVAQNNTDLQLIFNTLGIKEGLPEGTARALFQDKEGYIWIGTQNGLVRFDGYRVKNYPYKLKTDYSKFINGFFEDKNHTVWISTTDDLYYYDRLLDSVILFGLFKTKHISILAINDIIENPGGGLWISFADVDLGKQKYVLRVGLLDSTNRRFDTLNALIWSDLFVNQHTLWFGAENSLYEYIAADKKFKVHLFNTDIAHLKWARELVVDSIHPELIYFLVSDKATDNWDKICRYNTATNILITIDTLINNGKPPRPPGGGAYRSLTDSKKRTWFSTGKGLFLYDAIHDHYENFLIPGKEISPGDNAIWTIKEDKISNLWCQTNHGLLYFNTNTGIFSRSTFYETIPTGLKDNTIINLITDRQGMPWFGANQSGVQWLNKNRSNFNVYSNSVGTGHYFPGGIVTSIAKGSDGKYWVGSRHGLYLWTPSIDSFMFVLIDKRTHNDIAVNAVITDKEGRVWFHATSNDGIIKGLFCYNPIDQRINNYQHRDKDSLTISSDNISSLALDKDGIIWVGTWGHGMCNFNVKTQKSRRFPYMMNNNSSRPTTNVLDDDEVEHMYLDEKNILWIGTNNGSLNRFDIGTGQFTSFMGKIPECVTHVIGDKMGNILAGTFMSGLVKLNTRTNTTKKYSEKDGLLYDGIEGLAEDNDKNIWIGSGRGFSILNTKTNQLRNITPASGLPEDPGFVLFKMGDGKILYSTRNGFVTFNPEDFKPDTSVPQMHVETVVFKYTPVNGQTDKDSLINCSQKTDIHLKYNENRLTFNYIGLLYQNTALIQYAYKLDGYDKDWINIGTQRLATYTNLSAGTYTFHVKAANSDGIWTTKDDVVTVIISPPWWKSWWAYLIYAIIFAALLRGYIVFRSRSLKRRNILLERKVEQRTHQLSEANEELQASQENVAAQRDELAHAIDKLHATQSQLIQSEKMASMGELTAGIAHEIQNPLNFVNNFSEVNRELLIEMKDEMDNGNIGDAKTIADDIISNEEKINYHGKRADAIVKGMLQHSRTSNGEKEPTDINKLADEYLKLAYHGLRAKDKSFNASLKTDYDPNIGKVNIIAQDMGRVMLNLINNAFYAVDEKKKRNIDGYEPTVSISTRKLTNQIETVVKDNGNGIPQKILDKIFQPFFTTKPTGQGTGLGLSLAYDIVKAHGGEIKVVATEGEGSAFVVQLPV